MRNVRRLKNQKYIETGIECGMQLVHTSPTAIHLSGLCTQSVPSFTLGNSFKKRPARQLSVAWYSWRLFLQ